MENELRKSGIGIIGNISWGSHICLFYRTSKEITDMIVPYFRAGLKNNELCLWIVEEPIGEEAALIALRRSIKDIDSYTKRGQMEIIPQREWYLKNGKPDFKGVTRKRSKKLNQARTHGLQGMRVAGYTSWVNKKDWADFMKYERETPDQTGNMITMCLFSQNNFDVPEIIDIVNTHQYAIIKRCEKWDIIERHEGDKIEGILDRRVRELMFLYDIASITGEPHISLNERFSEIVNLLPNAFKYPYIGFARIQVNEDEHKTANYQKSDLKISSDIIVRGTSVGEVEVGYLKSPSIIDNGLFLKEEELLLDAIAERLGIITEHWQAEEALKKSEEKFSVAFNASPDIMYISRMSDGTFIDVNDNFLSFFGYTREEVIGRNTTELGIFTGTESINNLFHIRDDGGKIQGQEISLRNRWGKTLTALTSVEHITIGSETCTLAALIDITDLKKVETALRESEEKFAKAFNATPSIVSITNFADGKIIDVNDKYLQSTGFSREEVIGRNTLEIGNWLSEADRAKMIQNLKTQGYVRGMEVRSRLKSGEVRIGLVSAELIDFGGETRIITVVNDITEQRQSQELLQTVSHNSPLGIYIVQNDRIKYTNPQFQKITGYNQEELMDRELLSIIAVEDADVFKSSTVFTLREHNPYPCEYRILSKTGQIKWVMQTVSPIHYEGKAAILGNIMDITERKYLERKVIEYEELNKMKSDLLATVSHELRTPLATIKGYSTMILDYYSRLSSDETKEYLKSIDHSTNRLSKLVDNLLDTSRMEAGLLKLEKSTTNLTLLIKAVVTEANIRASSHQVVANLDTKFPKVMVDAKRIRQVLDNLVDNAIKYSPAESEIVLTARRDGPDLLISVTDQGPGIPPEELTKIFDRMYRIEQRLYSGAEGVGLGLYICQRLIEAHGGKIWAESTVGEGSIILFTIPGTAIVTKTR